MLKIEDADKKKRQIINKIKGELERICSTVGESESEEDQKIMKSLDDLFDVSQRWT